MYNLLNQTLKKKYQLWFDKPILLTGGGRNNPPTTSILTTAVKYSLQDQAFLLLSAECSLCVWFVSCRHHRCWHLDTVPVFFHMRVNKHEVSGGRVWGVVGGELYWPERKNRRGKQSEEQIKGEGQVTQLDRISSQKHTEQESCQGKPARGGSRNPDLEFHGIWELVLPLYLPFSHCVFSMNKIAVVRSKKKKLKGSCGIKGIIQIWVTFSQCIDS